MSFVIVLFLQMKSKVSGVLMTETLIFELWLVFFSLRNLHLFCVGLKPMDQGYIVHWWLDPTYLQNLLDLWIFPKDSVCLHFIRTRLHNLPLLLKQTFLQSFDPSFRKIFPCHTWEINCLNELFNNFLHSI